MSDRHRPGGFSHAGGFECPVASSWEKHTDRIDALINGLEHLTQTSKDVSIELKAVNETLSTMTDKLLSAAMAPARNILYAWVATIFIFASVSLVLVFKDSNKELNIGSSGIQIKNP